MALLAEIDAFGCRHHAAKHLLTRPDYVEATYHKLHCHCMFPEANAVLTKSALSALLTKSTLSSCGYPGGLAYLAESGALTPVSKSHVSDFQYHGEHSMSTTRRRGITNRKEGRCSIFPWIDRCTYKRLDRNTDHRNEATAPCSCGANAVLTGFQSVNVMSQSDASMLRSFRRNAILTKV